MGMIGRPLFVLLAFASLMLNGCGVQVAEPSRPISDPLSIPLSECLERYHENEDIGAAIEAGDTHVIRCMLVIQEGSRPDDSFRLRYFLYRLEGVEPEGLDEIVRDMDRRSLAAKLGNEHMFTGFLEPFGFDRRGCPSYDPVARELLLRARPPEEDDPCLPGITRTPASDR